MTEELHKPTETIKLIFPIEAYDFHGWLLWESKKSPEFVKEYLAHIKQYNAERQAVVSKKLMHTTDNAHSTVSDSPLTTSIQTVL